MTLHSVQVRRKTVQSDAVTYWRTGWRIGDHSGGNPMATKATGGALHRLTTREIQKAGDGDHVDGGGLQLRVRAGSAS